MARFPFKKTPDGELESYFAFDTDEGIPVKEYVMCRNGRIIGQFRMRSTDGGESYQLVDEAFRPYLLGWNLEALSEHVASGVDMSVFGLIRE